MRAVFLGMVAISIAIPAYAENPIKNGSFETPAVPKGSFQRFEPGDKIGAWTVVGGPVELVSDTYADGNFHFNAGRGHQWLNLCADPGEHGGIQQTVRVIALEHYALDASLGSVFDPQGAYGSITRAKAHIGGEGHTFSFHAAPSSDGEQQWGMGGEMDVAFGSTQRLILEIDGVDLDKDCAIDAVSMDGF